ncbi:hypothetical protein PV325_002206 [Microctonus aethiopoides]|uniref:Uncharacterized protein n=1 Tax=Microctonus aethiopoides TaxID=144406 RepID=A0AA39F989_9HYME|nr:hypothetical protein PV325_002206 [Microctonus aethiopoides]KAK0098953.1 hypothetical protein PV326_012892 [Microctonus aethiopoides]KAK0165307.1 hypothetical protein PV328_003833 [Microctonus aethiopoides]
MGTSSDQHYCLRWNNHQLNMLTVFDELLQNEAFTDVALGVDEGIFVKCHRMILAACSSYFQKLFVEIPCKNPIIILKDVKYTQIKAILEYMYRGEVSIAQDQLSTLLEIAECLKIKGLVEDNGSSSTSDDVSQTPQTTQYCPETENSSSPPPTITTSTVSSNIPQNSDNGNEHTSPPHSTSAPYHIYGKSPSVPINRTHIEPRLPTPMWNIPFAGHQNLTIAHQTSQSAHQQSFLASHYESIDPHNTKRLPNLPNFLTNRDTPILRGVLGQGHADSSQGMSIPRPDSRDYRSPSNESANDNAEVRRNSMDVSHDRNSMDLSGYNLSPINDERERVRERRRSPKFHEGTKKSQKVEWKRYKQYTKRDIELAIDDVKGGMSALKAAKKHGVPSRTLYDKVKKMGMAHSRRSSNPSSASFPRGIGGNINGNIYASIYNNDSDNLHSNLTRITLESSAALIESALSKNRDNSNDQDAEMDILSRARANSSPILSHSNLSQQQQQLTLPPILPPSQSQHQHDTDNEVEDLSINRKSDHRVIVPPLNIKEENSDPPENLSRT